MKKIFNFFLFFTWLLVLTSCKTEVVHIDTLLVPETISEPAIKSDVINKAKESHVVVRYMNVDEKPSLVPHYNYYESDGFIFLHEVVEDPTNPDLFYVVTMQPSYRIEKYLKASNYLIFFNDYAVAAKELFKIQTAKTDNGLDRLTDFMDIFALSFECNKSKLEKAISRSITPITISDYSDLLSDKTNSLADINAVDHSVFSVSHNEWVYDDTSPLSLVRNGYLAQIAPNQKTLNPFKREEAFNNHVQTTGVQLDIVLNDGNFGSPVFDRNGKLLGIFISKWSLSSRLNLDKLVTMLPSFAFKSALVKSNLHKIPDRILEE